MTLREILDLNQWGNTIVSQGTDKNTTHPYVDRFYETELTRYRDQPVAVLELGVFCGASVHLWHEYFSQGTIVGLDLVDAVLPEHRSLPRAQYLFRDAYHPGIFPDTQQFDIIIDDGPHTFESQIWAMEFYLPHLAPGGLFVIEDVQNTYYPAVFHKLVPPSYQSETIDLRPYGRGHMDILFVVRRP